MVFSEEPLLSLVPLAFEHVQRGTEHFWQVASCIQLLTSMLGISIVLRISREQPPNRP